MLRRLALVVVIASLSACPRDLGLPGPPAPGTIQGRVVYAVPEVAEKKAAAGASVTVLGTSLGAMAGPDGRFVVEGITTDHGSLLVQADLNGYGPQGINGVALRPGEDFQLGEVTLRASTAAPQPGAVSGHLSLSPPAADASAATVQAFPLAGNPLAARVSAGGAFSLTAVSPGLYRVEAAFTGYTRAVAANVFVGAGQQVALAISLAKDGVTVSPP